MTRFMPLPASTSAVHPAIIWRFASFCHALMYNIPTLIYLSPLAGYMTSYPTKTQHHQVWSLDKRGRNTVTYENAQVLHHTPLQSMVDCDQVAERAHGTFVNFTAHAQLTRIAQK